MSRHYTDILNPHRLTWGETMKIPQMPPLPTLKPADIGGEIIKPYSGEYEVVCDIWDRNGLPYLYTGDRVKVIYKEVQYYPVMVSVWSNKDQKYISRYVYKEENFLKKLKYLKRIEDNNSDEEDREGMIQNPVTGEWKWF